MKYTILMSCGHEDTIELFGKNSERERKIEYFKFNGLCKKCYKKKMEEQTASEGLIFNGAILPYIDKDNGNILINVWFSGNTKPYKEKIKELLGYRWCERETLDDMFSMSKPQLYWNKIITIEEYQNEVEKVVSIGAKIAVAKDDLYTMISYKMAADAQKEWKLKKGKVAEIAKPDVPEIIKGCKWNQKIYGKAGGYSIYPNGQKTMISDKQADEIKKYLKAKDEYDRKVEEIKNA